MSAARKASHEENMVLIIRSTKALPKEQVIKALDDYYNGSGVFFRHATFPTHNLLFEAINCGNYWAVDWLFNKKKCDPNFSKNPLRTPLSAAIQYADTHYGNYADSEDSQRRRNIVKFLLEKGAIQTPELLNIALRNDNLFYVDCCKAKDADYESLTIAVSKKTDEEANKAIRRIGEQGYLDIASIIKKAEQRIWRSVDDGDPKLLLRCISEGKFSAAQYILRKGYFSKEVLKGEDKAHIWDVNFYYDSTYSQHKKSELCIDAIYEAWNSKKLTCEQAIQFYQEFLSAGCKLGLSFISTLLENKNIPLLEKTQMLKFVIAKGLRTSRDDFYGLCIAPKDILKIDELDDNELLIAALKNYQKENHYNGYDSKTYSQSISQGKIEKVKMLMKNDFMFPDYYEIPELKDRSEDSRRTQDFVKGHRLLLQVLRYQSAALIQEAKRFVKDMHPADVDDLLAFCNDPRILAELQAVKPAPLEIPIAPAAPSMVFFPAPMRNRNVESKQDTVNENRNDEFNQDICWHGMSISN